MTVRLEIIGEQTVLFFPEDGRQIAAPPDTNDLLGEAMGHGATFAVLPLSRLSPDFLKLSTRLAGEIIQKFVNYQIQLAILGDVGEQSERSGALRDFIHESNRGRSVWFLPDEAALRARLQLG